MHTDTLDKRYNGRKRFKLELGGTELAKSAIVLCGACHHSMPNNILGYWECENGDCPQAGVMVGQDEDEEDDEEDDDEEE